MDSLSKQVDSLTELIENGDTGYKAKIEQLKLDLSEMETSKNLELDELKRARLEMETRAIKAEKELKQLKQNVESGKYGDPLAVEELQDKLKKQALEVDKLADLLEKEKLAHEKTISELAGIKSQLASESGGSPEEKIRALQKNLKSAKSALVTQEQDLEKGFESERRSLNDTIKELTVKNEVSSKKILELQAEIDALKRTEQRLQLDVDTKAEKLAEFENTKLQLEARKTDIVGLKEAMEIDNERLIGLQKNLDQLGLEHDALLKKLAATGTGLGTKADKLDQLRSQRQSLGKDIDTIRGDLGDTPFSNIEERSRLKKDLAEKIRKLKEAELETAKLRTELESDLQKQGLVGDFQEELTQVRLDNRKLVEENLELRKKYSQLEALQKKPKAFSDFTHSHYRPETRGDGFKAQTTGVTGVDGVKKLDVPDKFSGDIAEGGKGMGLLIFGVISTVTGAVLINEAISRPAETNDTK